MGYSFRLAARVLLYAPSHRQDSTYHSLCYGSRGALAGTRNSSMGPPHEDRSDDPSHHERTLLPQRYISLPYIHHPIDRIAHTTAIVTAVVEHWLEREIAQWVHPMKDRSDDPSHHERTLLPQSYISLPYIHHPRQDSTYHSLCYGSRGALAGTRNSSMGPPHEGSIRRPIAP